MNGYAGRSYSFELSIGTLTSKKGILIWGNDRHITGSSSHVCIYACIMPIQIYLPVYTPQQTNTHTRTHTHTHTHTYIYIYIYIYSDTHKYWIHVIFCYNSSLCSPFCLIFGK